MRFLALIGALAIILAIGAAIFFFGGFYSVAESEDDPAIVSWALAHVRAASVARHATEAPPASLDDPATVKAGARAYATIGCVELSWRAAEQRLGQVVRRAEAGSRRSQGDGERSGPRRNSSGLIKNGIKMTGMPSFGLAGASDQQIWTIVAFIKKSAVHVGRGLQELDGVSEQEQFHCGKSR